MTRPLLRRRVLAGLPLLAASPALAAPSGKPRVTIRTDHGIMVVELEAAKAPVTTANFLRYVDTGKYDGGLFYRRTRARGGAPTEGTVVAKPNPRSHPFPPIAHESTRQTGLRHRLGTVSLGRFAPGSATGDFFICTADTPAYDAHAGKGDTEGYAAFGQVVSGLPVLRRIHAQRADGPSPYPDQKGEWLNPPVAILQMRRTA